MANPQLENGYTKIANEIMDFLARFYMPGRHWQCLNCIIRNIYGWKDMYFVKISLGEMAKRTGLFRHHVSKLIGELEAHKIIKSVTQEGNTVEGVVTLSGNTLSKVYEFNKNFDEWIGFGRKQGVTQEGNRSVTQEGNRSVTQEGNKKKAPTIYKRNKDIKRYRFKKLTQIPDGFQVLPEMEEYAKKKGYQKNLEPLTERFVIHHDSKGSKYKDWYRAWQKWLLNDIEWNGLGEPKEQYFPD